MIVLAGGIGSGKSVVSRILRLKGFGVYDCDYEAKKLMEFDSVLKEDLVEIAGAEIYNPDGKVDRKYLSSRLFEDKLLRCKVNASVHNRVKQGIRDWLAESPENIFVETAIAAESGLAGMADCIWLIDADREIRIERVRRRDGRNLVDIERILAAQEAEEKKFSEGEVRTERILNNPDDRIMDEIDKLIKNI